MLAIFLPAFVAVRARGREVLRVARVSTAVILAHGILPSLLGNHLQ
jgi:hypothetical protein